MRYSPRKMGRCKVCFRRPATKLCDQVVGPEGKTCDKAMCAGCAKSVGEDLDYCPDHALSGPQLALF